MSENLLISLASVIILGIGSEWLAWRLRLPSILLLLISGFIAGPVTGLLSPDRLMGDLLLPVVSVSVAIILFEGGLSLRIAELREIGKVVRNLVTAGVLITGLVGAAAAHVILNLDLPLAILLGTILVISGPTVIVPLLNHLRPRGKVGSILKWEGIIVDPVGAILAVLIFEAIFASGFQEATTLAVISLVKTISIGVIVGALTAGIMVLLLKHYWVPDFLHTGVTLMMVAGSFAGSNLLQPESGLITVTLLGIILANQKIVGVKHIVKFQENLRVLLIATIFILLAARVQLSHLTSVGLESLLFLGVLVLIARPLAVIFSTIRSNMNWREKLFLSAVAPRGVVAAAIASILGLRLVEAGHSQAELILPLTFIVISGTVIIYSIVASPLAQWTGLADQNPQGTLVVGAQPWARAIAQILQEEGYQVLLIDTNLKNIRQAHKSGLPAYQGNILHDQLLEEIELQGIGRLIALTSNDGVNSLACLHFSDLFGSSQVYQLSPENIGEEKIERSSQMHGRLLFDKEATYRYLNQVFARGTVSKNILNKVLGKSAIIKNITLEKKIDYEEFRKAYGATPLFLIDENNGLIVFATDNKPTMRVGHRVICLAEEKKSKDILKTRRKTSLDKKPSSK